MLGLSSSNLQGSKEHPRMLCNPDAGFPFLTSYVGPEEG